MLDIVISMVIYNDDREELLTLINELEKVKLNKKICIVDNSDTEILSEKFLKSRNLVYIKTEKNIGFGKGHNIIIDKYKTGSKIILLLNADIEINADDIAKGYNFLVQNLAAGVLSPKIIHEDVSEHLLSTAHLVPSPCNLLFKRFFYKFFKNYIYNYNLTMMDTDKMQFVPNLSGCCLFIKSEVFEKVGLFDERFFLYMEDVDFIRRVAEKFDTLYFPSISVKHKRKSLSYKKLKYLFIHIKSAIKYFNKWGWFFDKKRKSLNQKTLKLLKRRM